MLAMRRCSNLLTSRLDYRFLQHDKITNDLKADKGSSKLLESKGTSFLTEEIGFPYMPWFTPKEMRELSEMTLFCKILIQ